MGYNRGDSFPFDFEPNGFPFGSKSKRKLSPRSYPIQFERKWKYSFLSVEFPRGIKVIFCVNLNSILKLRKFKKFDMFFSHEGIESRAFFLPQKLSHLCLIKFTSATLIFYQQFLNNKNDNKTAKVNTILMEHSFS